MQHRRRELALERLIGCLLAEKRKLMKRRGAWEDIALPQSIPRGKGRRMGV